MSSMEETVQSNDEAIEVFISGIDSNGIILYEQDLNNANEGTALKNLMDYSDKAIEGQPVETVEEITIDSLEEPYYPFKDNRVLEDTSDESLGLPKDNSVNSQIGPFNDNRPICDCDTIKQLFASTDARYLLSLLPDMAEMNPKQKIAFKNRVFQLINRILNGDSIDVDI